MGSVEFSLYLVKDSLINRADDRFKEIMRWKDVDLFRQPLSFLFPADAHGRVEKLLKSKSKLLAEVIFPRVPIRVKTGGYVNFDMKMLTLDDGVRRLDFYRPGLDDPVEATETTDMYSFFNFVEELLGSPYDGDMALTMVDVGALRDAGTLSDEDKKNARSEIEKGLQAKAVGGKLGKLDEASYGLITKGDFDEKAFEREMLLVAKKLNLDPTVLSVRSVNVDIDDTDLPPEQLRQALSHSRGVFLGDIKDEHGLKSLTGVIDGIAHNRGLIERALKKYQYRTSARLVSDNIAAISVSQLQQGKVNLEGKIRLPDEILVMADHPDLALQHDVAQLDDMIRLRGKRQPDERAKPDFYELCRSTLVQEAFAEKLEAMLKRHGEIPQLVGFRVRGMPPVKRGGLHWEALNGFAAKGHPIWIDRFGDAVLAPEEMGCLKNGYVEIPRKLMKTLAGHFDGKELMGKLIKTWRSLGVVVLSVDLPDYEMKTIAQELGISVSVEDAPEAAEELAS